MAFPKVLLGNSALSTHDNSRTTAFAVLCGSVRRGIVWIVSMSAVV